MLMLLTSIPVFGVSNASDPLTEIGIVSSTGGSRFGHFVEHIPDINGDGLSDLLVGNPYNNSGGTEAGEVYLFFSPLQGIDKDNIHADITITGTGNGQHLGYSGAYLPNVFTAGAGGEIAIGAPGNNSDNGTVFIFELGDISGGGAFDTGNAAYKINGTGTENFGQAVSPAGDFDDDGTPDLLVGAPSGKAVGFGGDGNRSGRAYVFFGGGVSPGVDSTLADVTIAGFEDGEKLGFSVSYAGDVNSDDADDIIVGAPENHSSGKALVFFGGAVAASMDSDDADVNISEGTPGMELGYSVNHTGDFNGDGIHDVIIGAPGFNGGRGEAFVVFGNATLADIDLGVPGASFIAFIGNEVGRLGHSVSGSDDMDADGFADCMVGAPFRNESRGFAYSFFGNDSFPVQFIPVTEANATNNGTAPGEQFGYWVSEGGDVNGDQYADAIVGAPNASGGWGKAYVFKLDHLPTLAVPTAVQPGRGNSTTAFTYRVIYTDIEGDPPAALFPKVRISRKLDGTMPNATTPNSMTLDPGASAELRDGDYTNGEQYYFSTRLGTEQQYNYLFETRAASGLDDLVETALQANDTTGPMPIVDTTSPSQISNVTALDTPGDHGGSIDVTWNRCDDVDLERYEVYVDDEPFTSVQDRHPAVNITDNETTASVITSFEGSPLMDYTSYWIGVGARDDVGNRRIAVTGKEVIPKDNYNLLPGEITDLYAQSGNDEGKVILNWTAVGENGMIGGPVSEYLLRFSTVRQFIGPSDWESGTPLQMNLTPLAPGGEMVVTIQGLAVGVEHFFSVRSKDGVGQISNLSNSVGAYPGTAPDLVPPDLVFNVELFDIPNNSTSIGILWEPVTSLDFDHYNIYISTHPFSDIKEDGVELERSDITSRSTRQSYISSMGGASLTFGETYYVALTAVDRSGNENSSAICSYGHLHKDDFDVTPPTAVTGVGAEDTEGDMGSSVTVTWDRCEAVDFLLYRIYTSTDRIITIDTEKDKKVRLALEEFVQGNTSTLVTAYGGVPLENGRKYYFAVVAQDFNEQVSSLENGSVFGPVEPVNDGDTEVPPPVEDFKAEDTGSNYTILGWTPFLRDALPDFHQYVIFYSTETPLDPVSATRLDGTDIPSLLSIGARDAEVRGLMKETVYYFAILCQDDRMGKESDLEGNLSAEIKVTTASPNVQPVLDEASVEFDDRTEDSDFTFTVRLRDPDSLPVYVKVVIDNESHVMEHASGNISTGAIYTFSTKLTAGTHEYYFEVLDTYFSGDDSRAVKNPTTPDSIVVKKRSGGSDKEGLSPAGIAIIIVVLLLVGVAVVLLLLLRRKKADEEETTPPEEEVEKEVGTWTCSCGEVTIPVTETAHCGFCGEYHEPEDPLADIPETHIDYPDYTQSDLYGNLGASDADSDAGAAAGEPEREGGADLSEGSVEQSTIPSTAMAEQSTEVSDNPPAIPAGAQTPPVAPDAQAISHRTRPETTGTMAAPEVAAGEQNPNAGGAAASPAPAQVAQAAAAAPVTTPEVNEGAVQAAPVQVPEAQATTSVDGSPTTKETTEVAAPEDAVPNAEVQPGTNP